ncbi:protein neprosin-like [Cryptomeria japonica]|uniref:protein neprosin-like n=1 Tax=Cryptomeria japonica TaxID=3369 RepID=UPI0027DA9822|nr:protein neprosin-like [Cryptomeria japonica]
MVKFVFSLSAMAFQKVFWASVFFTFLHSLLFIVAVDVTNMTIDEYVNYINPPALHNYEDEFGDSILCVKHSDQISLNPEGHSKKSSDISYKGLNISVKRCPEGTISVREIKHQHVERAGSVARFLGQTKSLDASDDDSVQEYAYVQFNAGAATKAEAFINTWSPYVTSDAIYSRSQMWVMSADQTQILVSGWQVYPELYQDERPRLFTYWTADGFETSGCYDLSCPGFVVASGSQIQPGSPIKDISIDGGTQYSFSLRMSLEIQSNTPVWALYASNNLVGYWNTSFIPSLGKFGDQVAFGGEVKFHSKGAGTPHTNTDMGSGHFPGSGDKKVAHIREIKISDTSGKEIDPSSEIMHNHKECYDVQYNVYEEPYGHTIFFGGPGGDVPQCHNIGI